MDAQKSSQDKLGAAGGGGGTRRSCPGPEEEPEPGPLGSACPEFCPYRLRVCGFLENRFLGEEVKFIKEMSSHVKTSRAGPPPPAPRWASRSPKACGGASRPAAPQGPSASPLVSGCLSLSPQTLGMEAMKFCGFCFLKKKKGRKKMEQLLGTLLTTTWSTVLSKIVATSCLLSVLHVGKLRHGDINTRSLCL